MNYRGRRNTALRFKKYEKLSDRDLHIVAFDVPDPPDYGGVIDVFYKIKALAKLGVKIHLHCFQYGRNSSLQLEELCATVTYYQRSKSLRHALSRQPFIVESRRNQSLLKNLQGSPFPILFEGLHTTAFLNHPSLKNRIKLVRAHNVEHDYYQGLAQVEKNPVKKLFFKKEAEKLSRYESVLKACQNILAISEKDRLHFQKIYGKTTLINPFHPFERTDIGGKNDYAFYHGNLEVPENCEALDFLVNRVFPLTDVPLMVAGNGAEKAVANLNGNRSNIKVVDSPSSEAMLELAKNASVHVLPTFQTTGFKLKLLYSMFTAKHIVANKMMVAGTGLENYCEIAESPQEMARIITKSQTTVVNPEMLQKRIDYLNEHFSNRKNALKIAKLLD